MRLPRSGSPAPRPRGRRLRGLVAVALGGLVVIGAPRARRRRQTPGGLRSFEGAPCFGKSAEELRPEPPAQR